MSYLTFNAQDRHFKDNLQAIREHRLAALDFGLAFEVVWTMPGGELKATAAKSAYVKGDRVTFEFDGRRIELERVTGVRYFLGGLK